MKEIFKPRENMSCSDDIYYCFDKNDFLICDGGPSMIWNNGHDWDFWIDGMGLHRLEGPASSAGGWFMFGRCVTPEIYTFAKENDIDLENLTDADKVMIALKFG